MRRLLPILVGGFACLWSWNLDETTEPPTQRWPLSTVGLFAGAIFQPQAPRPSVSSRLAKDTLSGEEEGLFDTLATETGSSLPDRALRLGLRRDPFATEQLLALAAQEPLDKDPQARLTVGLALSRHLHSEKDADVRRALMRLFDEANRTSLPGDDPRAERADATTAFILAKSGHPHALALLLAHASSFNEELRATRLARLALRAYPPSAEVLKSLPPIVSEETAQRAVRRARQDDSALAAKKALAGISTEDIQKAAEEGQLFELLDQAARYPTFVPKSLFSKSAWQKALSKNPTYALRSLTILSATVAPTLRPLAVGHADVQVRATEPASRSAAVWTLAVLAPRHTQWTFPAKDTVVSAAQFRQIGAICQELAQLPQPPPWDDPRILERCPLPPLRVTTTRLWELSLTEFLPSVLQLAARLSEGGHSFRSPGIHQVRTWLQSEDPHTRAAAAKGLGWSKAPSARGLLRAAYFSENAVEVRRAIVRSLFHLTPPRASHQSPEHPEPVLQFAAAYDPDAACRAFAVGRRDPENSGFILLQGVHGEQKVKSRLGIEYSGSAAPDGFFAIVDEEF